MPALAMFLGLAFATAGHALLHDWRGAVALYTEVDERFPAILRTASPVAGPLLIACGAACVLAPMFSGGPPRCSTSPRRPRAPRAR